MVKPILFNFRMSKALHRRLKRYAKTRGGSISHYIRMFIVEALEARGA